MQYILHQVYFTYTLLITQQNSVQMSLCLG